MKPYEKAALVKPSARQLEWQKTEFYGFINFGLATVLGREWSDGNLDPINFYPNEFDAKEWVSFFKESGFKGMVLNAKHHDGFCLWSSDVCPYNINLCTEWETDERDIVKMLSEECAAQGLKFGVAISPLDRFEKSYGSGDNYNAYFKKLLRELLTKYGEFFYVRFDGAAEPDKKGNIQEYDWEGYYEVVRECQPDAVIALVGPDVRWYGNESGVIRENEWSVVPKYYGIEAALERSRHPNKKDMKRAGKFELDIGSRKAIKKDEEFIWYPCEVSVSMRDRWFYHKDDEYTVKTKDKIHKLYLDTVGANCALMLGVPPMKTGKFDEMELQILRAFGYDLQRSYSYEVSCIGTITASSTLSPEYDVKNLFDPDENKTWKPAPGDKEPELTITLSEKDMFDKVLMMEHIVNGQHVEEYELYLDEGKGKFKKLDEGGIIGYKRIHKVSPTDIVRLKIKFTSFRGELEMERVVLH